MAKPLIIAASEFELSALREAEAAGLCFLLVSGIGATETSASVSSWLTSNCLNPVFSPSLSPISCMLFVGSCGSYLTELPIGAAVCCLSALLGDISLLRGEAYLPEVATREIPASPAMNKIVSSIGAVPTKFASTTAITASADLGEEITRLSGAFCENLEIFGVATVAAAHGIPWSALSVVTNHVGPNAHSEWRANFAQAADKTAQFVLRLMPSLLHLA